MVAMAQQFQKNFLPKLPRCAASPRAEPEREQSPSVLRPGWAPSGSNLPLTQRRAGQRTYQLPNSARGRGLAACKAQTGAGRRRGRPGRAWRGVTRTPTPHLRRDPPLDIPAGKPAPRQELQPGFPCFLRVRPHSRQGPCQVVRNDVLVEI